MVNNLFSEESINKISYKEIKIQNIYNLITKEGFKLSFTPITILDKNKYQLEVKDMKNKIKKIFPKKYYGKTWFVKKTLY